MTATCEDIDAKLQIRKIVRPRFPYVVRYVYREDSLASAAEVL